MTKLAEAAGLLMAVPPPAAKEEVDLTRQHARLVPLVPLMPVVPVWLCQSALCGVAQAD